MIRNLCHRSWQESLPGKLLRTDSSRTLEKDLLADLIPPAPEEENESNKGNVAGWSRAAPNDSIVAAAIASTTSVTSTVVVAAASSIASTAMSSGLFCTGVPVRQRRRSVCKAIQALKVLDLVFRTTCASSRMRCCYRCDCCLLNTQQMGRNKLTSQRQRQEVKRWR